MKTIIFGSPSSKDNLEHHIEQKLREYGYNVISVSYPFNDFKYKNFTDKIVNFIRKSVFRDETSKHKLKFKPYQKQLVQNVDNLEKADFSLIIRSDIYPENFIKKIRAKSNFMAGYQWDGIDVFPLVKPHIPVYDTFCVFDPDDFKYKDRFPNLKGVTNFFFETDTEKIKANEAAAIKNGAYYLGSYKKERIILLEEIDNALEKEGIEGSYNIFVPEKKSVAVNPRFNKLHTPVSYYDNLLNAYQSTVLVDIASGYHKGLSFRFFEAMAFEKKVITNNRNVKKYDFYRTENIFVWGEDSDFDNFLKTDYKSLPKEIYHKYSFKNWLKNVLNEADKIEIKLPE